MGTEAPQPLTNLYDEEIIFIRRLTESLTYKFSLTSPTPENLKEMQKHVVGRFYDAGFHVEMNMVDYLLAVLKGEEDIPPPEIVVIGRVNEIKEFDHEKKGWEVMKNGV